MTRSFAFWFSVVAVAYWAYWNFHRPHHPDVIRFSVAPRRYALGMVLHVSAALGVFFVALLAARLLLVMVNRTTLSSELGTGIPLAVALAVTVILPRLPGSRFLANEARKLAQGAALFPDAANRLSFLLAKAGCHADDALRAGLREELAIFALAPGALDHAFPPGALAPLEEAHALRERMLVALAQPRLATFARARARAIEEASLEHERLLRRAARATLLAEALREAPRPSYAEGDEQPGVEALAQFIREESNAVAARFHRLAAEAALSMFLGQQRRDAFLRDLGYEPPPPWDLPFASIVAVGAVAPATVTLFLLRPLLAMLLPEASPPASCGTGETVLAAPNSLAIATSFAALQVTIVLWAVGPKALTRWAWPHSRPFAGGSLGRVAQGVLALPLGSYLLAAAGAFGSQILIGVLLVQGGVLPRASPFCISSMQVMLVTSIFAVVSTVGLCVLIDLRILDRSYAFGRHRWRDGLILALAMVAADGLVVQQIIVALGGQAPGIAPTLMMGVLGFILGYLVPAAVAAWLNHRIAEVTRRVSGSVEAATI